MGPANAGQLIGDLVRDLITQDVLPEAVAYWIVCEGVLAGDPFLLIDPGQTWALRPETTERAPGLLLIIRRDADQLTVEDEHGQRHRIPVCALNTYALDQLFWARDGEPTPCPATPRTPPTHAPPTQNAVSVIGQETGIEHGSMRGYRQHTYQ
ncbi:hypothetical protein ACFVSQ_23945 [Streptomyces niveus]|uniref:hypothetical protein n=1 Tax=Streptomyces niveus TaxID=193462 RepID=UPI0036EB5E99